MKAWTYLPAQIDPQEYEECEDIEIYCSFLGSLVHELTHYFQWGVGLEQSDVVSDVKQTTSAFVSSSNSAKIATCHIKKELNT